MGGHSCNWVAVSSKSIQGPGQTGDSGWPAARLCVTRPMRRIHSILLVEDDQELQEAMAAILDAEGYRVIGAYDGQAAIDRLREGVRPSVIVLDLMLPRKDGRQFRAEQLADPQLADIPVIAYSGDTGVAKAAAN